MRKESIAKVAVIIVTHNSEKHLKKCLQCLKEQTHQANQILIIDSGSSNCSYLNICQEFPNVEVSIAGHDIGFCFGNNIGWLKTDPTNDFVLFLNPDAFLTPAFLAEAVSFMGKKENCRSAALTGTILGYDIDTDAPTGLYDSTGIFCTWWGRWYDRGQGLSSTLKRYDQVEEIPAICGAVYFCRKEALDSVAIRRDEVFDGSFYMYKEDIDLSLRLKKRGWHLNFVPSLVAYHCRGWDRNRKKVPKVMRLYSARNELFIHLRNRSPIRILYSLIKYMSVRCFNI